MCDPSQVEASQIVNALIFFLALVGMMVALVDDAFRPNPYDDRDDDDY